MKFWKLSIIILCSAWCFACGASDVAVGPSESSDAAPVSVRHPRPGDPNWDTLPFFLDESESTYGYPGRAVSTANPTFRISPNRWLECKFGGCKSHEVWHYDDAALYLDEDHSMNGGQPWKVNGNPRIWIGRRAMPGEVLRTVPCLRWFNHPSCSVNIDCHAIYQTNTFLEFVEDFDFKGDVGVRDAIVLGHNPKARPDQPDKGDEISVFVRGVGRVYWSGPEVGITYQANWRRGPWKTQRVSKGLFNPAQAVICVW